MTLDTYGRAMPSALHQKGKFMVEEQLINKAAKEDIVVALTTSNSYIDIDENTIECSFQSLEVVNATFVGEGDVLPLCTQFRC